MLGELENRGLGARSSCLPTIASYLEGSARNAVYQWFNGNVVRHDTALKKTLTTGEALPICLSNRCQSTGEVANGTRTSAFWKELHTSGGSLSRLWRLWLPSKPVTNKQYLTNLTCVCIIVYTSVYMCHNVFVTSCPSSPAGFPKQLQLVDRQSQGEAWGDVLQMGPRACLRRLWLPSSKLT